ncbi:unnamed protein product [Caenorhabditis angaria]|uniref:Uncharacterized protein n=1 Tax=Caenorhabditis angaria TaxID=860376 RepID=A0A9P1N129_9PELO|nr:unnamed protein product [Caenorhabditis angaria]
MQFFAIFLLICTTFIAVSEANQYVCDSESHRYFKMMYKTLTEIKEAVVEINHSLAALNNREHSKILRTFDDSRIILWILSPIIFGTIWQIIIYNNMKPTQETREVLKPIFLAKMNLSIDNVVYIGATFYAPKTGGIVISTLVLVAFIMLVSIFSFAIIISIAWRTFVDLRRSMMKRSTSTSSSKLQTQTFYALVSQTCIPILLMHFPCLTVMIAAIFDCDLASSVSICAITFAIFPAIDPLPVMLIIQNYREFLMGCFGCKKSRSLEVSSNNRSRV